MLPIVHLEPDALVPDHARPHEPMGIVILGQIEFTIGGVSRVLGPGDIWRIAGGVVRRVQALRERAVALDVFHPVREDSL